VTLDRQKQLLQEIVSEYDLQTVIAALLVQHPLDAIEDALRGVAAKN
jgi:nitrate reductase NapAB chaperone NapD